MVNYSCLATKCVFENAWLATAPKGCFPARKWGFSCSRSCAKLVTIDHIPKYTLDHAIWKDLVLGMSLLVISFLMTSNKKNYIILQILPNLFEILVPSLLKSRVIMVDIDSRNRSTELGADKKQCFPTVQKWQTWAFHPMKVSEYRHKTCSFAVVPIFQRICLPRCLNAELVGFSWVHSIVPVNSFRGLPYTCHTPLICGNSFLFVLSSCVFLLLTCHTRRH